MRVDVAGVLAGAWRLAKRDRDLLVGVAGPFVFVPQLAMQMFVAAPPPFPGLTGDTAAVEAWMKALELWSQRFSLAIIAIQLVALFGMLAVLTLYLDPRRPEVRAALAHALALFPRFLLLSIVASLPLGLGVALLVLLLPAIYIAGRWLAAAPILVAERPVGVLAALRRSFAITRAQGLPLMGLACITIFFGPVVAMPFQLLGATLDGAPLANPVAAALLDIGTAAGVTIGAVAALLIQVALYRRLAPSIGT